MGDDSVPAWLVRWGDISWRLIAMGVVVFFGFRILTTISVVVLATVIALFLAAVLWSPARWLRERGLPPALASFLTLLAAVLVIVGVFAFIVPQVVDSFETLSDDLSEAWESLEDWLIEGPFAMSESQIETYVENLVEWAQGIGQESIIGGATAALEFVTGLFLMLIITFFIIKDGKTLLDKLLERLPDETAGNVGTGASVARQALAQYMGGIALVGAFDAVLIGVALWIVGSPLVIPLALLVFFGAFIPLVGAFVSGLLAVAVTLVNVGFIEGLIILAVTVAVQQFEGDVIMPMVFGQTLRLHPLVILLGVTAGGLAFGLFGAFLAVPLIAVAVSVTESVGDGDGRYMSLLRG